MKRTLSYMFQWFCQLFLLYNRVPSSTPSVEIQRSSHWIWNYKEHSHKIHYEYYPCPSSNTSIVLIHGFGASTFQWRDNIPTLSKTHHVYAFDLLGFGQSDKPVNMEYTPEVWRDQTVDFVKEKISNNDVVIVGNSLGGYASIYAASQMDVSSVILLNPVAVFRQRELPFTSWFHWIAQPVIFRWLFHYFQSQIRPVLTTLYPCHPERVDDALVQSIEEPARDPNAREVFCKILQQQLAGKHPYMEDILQSVKMPVYLVVGKKDPWLLPTLYDDFLANCPTAFGKWVDAGHCPHDEIPDEVNHLILTFMTLSCEKI